MNALDSVSPRRGPVAALLSFSPLAPFTLILLIGSGICSKTHGTAAANHGTQVVGAGFSYGYSTHSTSHSGPEFSYAVVEPGTMLGTIGERSWEAIARAVGPFHETVFWFWLRGRDYLVRDRELVERARNLVAPMQELGARQGLLGAEQSLLGREQSVLGAEQAKIGVRQAELGFKLARISIRGTADDEPRRDAIEREMAELQRQQQELGRRQAPLSERQQELGRRQADLGEQQRQLSERVTLDIRRLAEEAISRGKAERLSVTRSAEQPPSNARGPGIHSRPAIDV